MLLRQIFDPQLAQYTYLIACQQSGDALLIDPERDIVRYQKIALENGVRITAVAETHIHADFLSGTQEFAQDHRIHIYLSAEGGPNWNYSWPKSGPCIHLLRSGDHFKVGNVQITALHTPGHTPEHMCYLITDLGGGALEPIAMITGDFLFMGDVGRPDLLESAAGMKNMMGPSARTLGKSLRETLVSYADYMQILPAHGAGSACGKSLGAVPTTTLGYERRFNPSLLLALRDAETFVDNILKGQPEPPLYFATMKKLNRDGAPITGGVLRSPKLDAEAFSNLTKNSSIAILDTRDNRGEFHERHVPRAISAPLHSPLFSNSAGSFIGEKEPFVVIVEKEEDIDLALVQLYRIGLDRSEGWITYNELNQSNLCSEKTTTISLETFRPEMLGTDGVILDVRNSTEYQRGHLAGSISIPYTRLRDRIAEVPLKRKLFVHCAVGKRASLATSFLAARGHEVVFLDGDIEECLANISEH